MVIIVKLGRMFGDGWLQCGAHSDHSVMYRIWGLCLCCFFTRKISTKRKKARIAEAPSVMRRDRPPPQDSIINDASTAQRSLPALGFEKRAEHRWQPLITSGFVIYTRISQAPSNQHALGPSHRKGCPRGELNPEALRNLEQHRPGKTT